MSTRAKSRVLLGNCYFCLLLSEIANINFLQKICFILAINYLNKTVMVRNNNSVNSKLEFRIFCHDILQLSTQFEIENKSSAEKSNLKQNSGVFIFLIKIRDVINVIHFYNQINMCKRTKQQCIKFQLKGRNEKTQIK